MRMLLTVCFMMGTCSQIGRSQRRGAGEWQAGGFVVWCV